MTNATPAELRDAITATTDLHAELVEDEMGVERPSLVNLRTDRLSRYADDTVWPPSDGKESWVWGPNFEHSCNNPDLTHLAAHIAATVKARA